MNVEALYSSPNDLGKVSSVELQHLKRVFNVIDTKKDGSICSDELLQVAVKLNHFISPADAMALIWEADDDLDGVVNWEEFLSVYQRCIVDQSGLQPTGLFNIIQFLIYDKESKGVISVEQTLQMLFVRHGRDRMDREVVDLFGTPDAYHDENSQSLTYDEYVRKVESRQQALRQRKPKVTVVPIRVVAPKPVDGSSKLHFQPPFRNGVVVRKPTVPRPTCTALERRQKFYSQAKQIPTSEPIIEHPPADKVARKRSQPSMTRNKSREKKKGDSPSRVSFSSGV